MLHCTLVPLQNLIVKRIATHWDFIQAAVAHDFCKLAQEFIGCFLAVPMAVQIPLMLFADKASRSAWRANMNSKFKNN